MLTVIRCGTLIDGTGRPPVPESRILVEGDRIAAVGDAARVEAPPGAAVIDLSGSTVLPGLIDSRTHLMLGFGDDLEERYPQPELYQMLKCVPHLRADIRAGITTIRNPSERSFRAAAVRHAVEQGLIPGRIGNINALRRRAPHSWPPSP